MSWRIPYLRFGLVRRTSSLTFRVSVADSGAAIWQHVSG
jgi:hypothetical protein